jgi:hypothetical protein
MKNCIKCGSHAFNLHMENIDQGGFCDVHYWQGRAHRAEAQPEQEPKHLVNVVIAHIKDLQKCVVELQKHGGFDETAAEIGVAANELEAALATSPAAQPAQQEPVGKFAKFTDGIWREVTDGSLGVSLYTAPIQRPWVGLTAQQAADCWTTSATKTWHNFEAALRSKNT